MSLLSELRRRLRERAFSRGTIACASCDTPGEHTPEQCVARRPWCHACRAKGTCIQARASGHLPTCLECFFERRIAVKDPEAWHNRFATMIPGLRSWREHGTSSPIVAAIASHFATDREAADVLAHRCAELEAELARALYLRPPPVFILKRDAQLDRQRLTEVDERGRRKVSAR